jgi:hypothetical protein
VTSRLLDLIGTLAASERYREAGWRRDRMAALVDAVRRQRVSQSLAGVNMAAYRPVDAITVDLVVVADGRFHASARCPRSQVHRVADDLRSRPLGQKIGDNVFMIATERGMLARWLSTRDIVLLWASGCFAEPVAGGQTLHHAAARLRRRRRTGAPADELTSKRLRRQVL